MFAAGIGNKKENERNETRNMKRKEKTFFAKTFVEPKAK